MGVQQQFTVSYPSWGHTYPGHWATGRWPKHLSGSPRRTGRHPACVTSGQGPFPSHIVTIIWAWPSVPSSWWSSGHDLSLLCPPAQPCIRNQTNHASSGVVIETRRVGPSMWLSGSLRRARGCVSWRWCDTVCCLFKDTFNYSLWAARTLKSKCHIDEIFINGCTGTCHFDNFWCI